MHKPLKKIIEEYGSGKKGGDHLFVRPLSESVHYGILWPELGDEQINGSIPNPRILYFIVQDAAPVGITELLESNLDCFMLPAGRSKGIFSKAMREIILPHILQRKPLQRLQINRSEYPERKFELLKKIFVSLGFSVLKEDGQLRMVIDGSKRSAGRFIGGENKPLRQRGKKRSEKIFYPSPTG